jgi:hypothetical protein
MTHRIREAVILITFSSARVHGRRTKLGIWRHSFCAAYFTGLSAVTEPTSEQLTKLINNSRLAKLTAVLAASAALMNSAEIANAKSDHHQLSCHPFFVSAVLVSP